MRKQLLSFVLAAGFLAAANAQADEPNGALASGVRRAANLQLARQQTYGNGDTGVGTYACAWEWEVGTATAYANTQGPSALGLVAAYQAFEKTTYLAGARCAADQMIARYTADTTKRPYSDDVIHLVQTAHAAHNPSYAAGAAEYHARTRAKYATGADLADHYIDIRASLAGWDLSSQIEAALAVGQHAYARGIALRLIERRGDWEGVLYGGYDYTLMGHGALLGALDTFKDDVVRDYRTEARADVLLNQGADGSWQGDFQITAYVLMGLETLPASDKVRRAINAGANFLLANETAAGGWSYPPEYGEINGEVLAALSSLVDDDHDRDEHGDRRDH